MKTDLEKMLEQTTKTAQDLENMLREMREQPLPPEGRRLNYKLAFARLRQIRDMAAQLNCAIADIV